LICTAKQKRLRLIALLENKPENTCFHAQRGNGSAVQINC